MSVGCSSFTIPFTSGRGEEFTNVSSIEISNKDYEDHLASLKMPFIETPGIKTLTLSEKNNKYIRNLILEIISQNEIFFKNLKKANVTILNTESPLHFSLPKGEIFLSKGLISKYIKNESILAGVLSYELIKSEKLIYPKQMIIPTGQFRLERMIHLNRLTLEEKMGVHKWAHHVSSRTGFDGEYYLSWLQTQNRNTADFILLVGDVNQITREESLFKKFMIENATKERARARKATSKSFYSFINSIREKS